LESPPADELFQVEVLVFQISKSRFVLAIVLASAWLTWGRLAAQDAASVDDPDQLPLGDIARNLRKNNPPPEEVIDNDNLDQVMNQAQNRHTSVLQFLMAGDAKNFRVAAPDVTCSLSFTAATKALLSDQYAQMELPPSEIFKLTGPATVEGDALSISLFNGTDWHVSEIDVALTVVKKDASAGTSGSGMVAPLQGSAPPALVLPQAVPQYDLESDGVRPEKKADRTIIFKMRAAAPPLSSTTFSAPLNLDLATGQEWHWAIVEAKGYPPQNRTAAMDQNSSADAPIDDPTPNPSPDQSVPPHPSPVALTQPQQ
jgi:hypothetical protein